MPINIDDLEATKLIVINLRRGILCKKSDYKNIMNIFDKIINSSDFESLNVFILNRETIEGIHDFGFNNADFPILKTGFQKLKLRLHPIKKSFVIGLKAIEMECLFNIAYVLGFMKWN